VKASIREELAEESPPHFWEVVDRGRNLHYLTGPERAKLDTFLGWLERRGPVRASRPAVRDLDFLPERPD
jgi:hypothetical protein